MGSFAMENEFFRIAHFNWKLIFLFNIINCIYCLFHAFNNKFLTVAIPVRVLKILDRIR